MRVMHAAPEPEASHSVGRVGTCMETIIFCFTVVGKCSSCLEFFSFMSVCPSDRKGFVYTDSFTTITGGGGGGGGAGGNAVEYQVVLHLVRKKWQK